MIDVEETIVGELTPDVIVKGITGKSTYDVWLDAGNIGTEEDFLNSLKGETGEPGVEGPKGDPGEPGIQGEKGDPGEKGDTPVKGVDYFTEEDIASLGIPKKTSELENDSEFTNKEYVDNAIANVDVDSVKMLEDNGIFIIKEYWDNTINNILTGGNAGYVNFKDGSIHKDIFNRMLAYGLEKLTLIVKYYKDTSIDFIFTYDKKSTISGDRTRYTFKQNYLTMKNNNVIKEYYEFRITVSNDTNLVTGMSMEKFTNPLATKEYVDNALKNVDLTNYYTKEEMDASLEAIVDEKLGDIDTILTQIVDSTLDAESKEY